MNGGDLSALFDAERHLSLFIQEVRDYALLMLDPEGHVMTWNSGAEAIKGYKKAEIAGRHFSVFYTPDDIAAGKPARGLAEAVSRGRFNDVGERVRKDGSRFLADVVITPIFDDQQRLLGFGKITRDVSERVAADERLRASEARLRSLVDTVLDTLVDGLIIIDRAGTMQTYNRACERLFGYRPDEVIGRNVKMLMPPEVSAEHDQYLENYQNTGIRKIIGISREVEGRRKDGKVFPMHLAVGEAHHLGQPVYVGIIRDLTERVRTEEQLRQSQKMEAVGQLTGGIAHDFNNILMVVLANADALVEEERLSAPVRARLEQIGKSTHRAADLTRQLLAFSRKQRLQPRSTELNEAVRAMSQLLRRTLGENIAIDLQLQADLWNVSIDRANLESALVNICLNGRDAMPSGGRLLIETRNAVLDDDYVAQNVDVVPGRYVLLAVSDSGVGIPREVLDRVFEPFFTTKETGKGTGLGLSMVYGFIKQSNGHIKIYSEPGHGTAVRMYLPVADSPAEEIEIGDSTDGVPRGRERVLLAEDDPLVRATIVHQLKSLGYSVTDVANGAAALAAFEAAAEPFDVLLTDLVMTGLDGRALAAELTRRAPTLVVLFMSGYSFGLFPDDSQFGPDMQLLTKPFRKAELAQMLRKAIASKKV